MKALTVKQPWAWAIIHAGKDVENRSWLTRYRGELAIHAGARMHSYTTMPRGVRDPVEDEIVFSAIIGIVVVVDSVERSRSKWFTGPRGLVLEKPRALKEPVLCKGALVYASRERERRDRRNVNGEIAMVNGEIAVVNAEIGHVNSEIAIVNGDLATA